MEKELRKALGTGSIEQVRELVKKGANLHYRNKEGYDALIDAVHGRDISRDQGLLPLLSYLASEGVNLSGETSYKESGLRVLSRIGRFDGVKFLLEAGADNAHLNFTPLMEAIAFGDLTDIQTVMSKEANLEDRDWWQRTPLLIAILTGNIEKVEFLLEKGSNLDVRGRCGQPPLFYAIQGHYPNMLKWLIEKAVLVHQTDEFGSTAIIEAVEENDLECVNILLDNGADFEIDNNGTALDRASSKGIVLRLLEAGANPADADHRVILGLDDSPDEAFSGVSQADYSKSNTRTFGKKNPQEMSYPFWLAMIRSGISAYEAAEWFKGASDVSPGPTWCAMRFGQSLAFLPDGRIIQIAGEHEDHYDPDFCIYNDVFVHETDGSIKIYGYPESIFPPTDFHTATLIGEWIYIIGNLGYRTSRSYKVTPVYRLDIDSFQFEKLDTTGIGPGQIHDHREIQISSNQIKISSGNICQKQGHKEVIIDNPNTFLLDVDNLNWRIENK